jgi:hypothetical protein
LLSQFSGAETPLGVNEISLRVQRMRSRPAKFAELKDLSWL